VAASFPERALDGDKLANNNLAVANLKAAANVKPGKVGRVVVNREKLDGAGAHR
jgi:archaellum component FlaG (FlaF/FlaG flagellin family)